MQGIKHTLHSKEIRTLNVHEKDGYINKGFLNELKRRGQKIEGQVKSTIDTTNTVLKPAGANNKDIAESLARNNKFANRLIKGSLFNRYIDVLNDNYKNQEEVQNKKTQLYSKFTGNLVYNSLFGNKNHLLNPITQSIEEESVRQRGLKQAIRLNIQGLTDPKEMLEVIERTEYKWDHPEETFVYKGDPNLILTENTIQKEKSETKDKNKDTIISDDISINQLLENYNKIDDNSSLFVADLGKDNINEEDNHLEMDAKRQEKKIEEFKKLSNKEQQEEIKRLKQKEQEKNREPQKRDPRETSFNKLMELYSEQFKKVKENKDKKLFHHIKHFPFLEINYKQVGDQVRQECTKNKKNFKNFSKNRNNMQREADLYYGGDINKLYKDKILNPTRERRKQANKNIFYYQFNDKHRDIISHNRLISAYVNSHKFSHNF